MGFNGGLTFGSTAGELTGAVPGAWALLRLRELPFRRQIGRLLFFTEQSLQNLPVLHQLASSLAAVLDGLALLADVGAPPGVVQPVVEVV